jgi:hypothetical protein
MTKISRRESNISRLEKERGAAGSERLHDARSGALAEVLST